jgi:hypothetical protein
MIIAPHAQTEAPLPSFLNELDFAQSGLRREFPTLDSAHLCNISTLCARLLDHVACN